MLTTSQALLSLLLRLPRRLLQGGGWTELVGDCWPLEAVAVEVRGVCGQGDRGHGQVCLRARRDVEDRVGCDGKPPLDISNAHRIEIDHLVAPHHGDRQTWNLEVPDDHLEPFVEAVQGRRILGRINYASSDGRCGLCFGGNDGGAISRGDYCSSLAGRCPSSARAPLSS